MKYLHDVSTLVKYLHDVSVNDFFGARLGEMKDAPPKASNMIRRVRARLPWSDNLDEI